MRNATEKIILALLAVILVGYGYYNYYLKGQIESISQIKKNVNSIKQNVQKLKNDEFTIDDKIEMEKLQSSELDEAIPNEYDRKVIIEYLYKRIKEHSLGTDRATLSEVTTKEYKTAMASFKITGSESNIKAFLKTIETDKRKFVIRQVNLSSDGKGGFNASVVLEFYSLK